MKTKFTLLAIAALTIFGCNRKTDYFEGPSLDDLYGDFAVLQNLTISNTNVDFSAGETTTFNAEFSKNVNWEIHITGQQSGSHKLIEGFSNVINSTWIGNTTDLPMFRAELCLVQLLVPSDSLTVSTTLTIASPKSNNGFVLADFESALNPGWGAAPNPNFVQSGTDMTFAIASDVIAGQGSSYFDMGGEVGWDWLKTLLEIPATAYGSDRFDMLSDNPSQVYFNVLLRKPAGVTNGLVLFQFREDDNGDGSFTEGSEDMYSLEIGDLQEGWQLITIRYSDMVALINGQPANADGNGIHEPHKINRISVLMLGNPALGHAQAYMDYMIFTEGSALNP